MTPLVTKEIGTGLRRNQNLKIRSLNLDLSQAYMIANIVVLITNVDSVQVLAKYVRHVIKTTLQRDVIQVRLKPKFW